MITKLIERCCGSYPKMTDNPSRLVNRRKVLAGAGGLAAAGVGAAVLSSSAAASAETGIFKVDDIETESHSGRLSSLKISGIGVTVEWEGFNAPADNVDWTLYADHPEEGEEEIASTSEDLGGDEYHGSKDSEMDSVDLIDVFGTEAFEADPHPDGDDYADHTESWDITFRLVADVEQVDGNTYSDEATGNSVTEVTNLQTDVETGGEADSIEAEEETGDEYYSYLVLDEESDGIEDNEANKEEDRPYIEWSEAAESEDGVKELELTFHNPTDFLFAFDYRIDDGPGEEDEWTGDTIEQGPREGQDFGELYNPISLDGGEGENEETVKVGARESVSVGITRGAEQNWYIRDIDFVAN